MIEKCECGWLLPSQAASFPAEPLLAKFDLNEEKIVPNTMVAFMCPVCEHGHVFYTPKEYDKFVKPNCKSVIR